MRVPDTSHGFIFWLFNHRCVGIGFDPCYKWANEISHIEPRSSGNNAKEDYHNLVLHCRDCHQKYHDLGASPEAIEDMKQKRAARLEALGKDIYI